MYYYTIKIGQRFFSSFLKMYLIQHHFCSRSFFNYKKYWNIWEMVKFGLHLIWSRTHSVPGHLVPHNWSPKTNSPGSFGPHGQMVPKTIGPHGQMVPKKIGPPGQTVPKYLVPMDKWSPRQLVPEGCSLYHEKGCSASHSG